MLRQINKIKEND